MNTINVPIHSTKTLIKASLLASVIAGVLLITCILPSEYNIDPTGVGEALGLTKLSQTSSIPEPLSTPNSTSAVKGEVKRDIVQIEIPANKGLEYKLLMDKHAHLEYKWQTDGAELFFDFHGEPKGDTTGYFESFSITTSKDMKGTLTTPFEGSHGWYWKNSTDEPVVVTLSIKGVYTIKG